MRLENLQEGEKFVCSVSVNAASDGMARSQHPYEFFLDVVGGAIQVAGRSTGNADSTEIVSSLMVFFTSLQIQEESDLKMKKALGGKLLLLQERGLICLNRTTSGTETSDENMGNFHNADLRFEGIVGSRPPSILPLSRTSNPVDEALAKFRSRCENTSKR